MQRALLILLFAASYLLFAGATTWSLVALLLIAAITAAAAPARTFEFPAFTRPFDRSLIAVLAAIAIQLVPLPAAIVSAISPRAEAITAAIRLRPLAATPAAWRTLSVDWQATLIAFGTVALGVLSFWIARGVFSAGGGTRLYVKAMTVLATLAATLAIVQKAVAPRSVLFILTPEFRSASPFGAFINRNHFAAWLLMVVAPVAGYAIARSHAHPTARGRWRYWIARVMASGVAFTIIGVMIIIGVLLSTLSRSGLAGLAATAIVGGLLGWPRLRTQRTPLPTLLGAIGAIALVMFLFVDLDRWAERFEQSFTTAPVEFSRVTIWRESLPIIKDFWVTGVGAGTYSDAMTVYQQTRIWVGSMQRWAHFNNAHSFYLQVVSEGGLLIAIPALLAALTLAALGVRAVRADSGEMFWVRAGALAGLAGVAVQSIWEVALIVPANAVLAGTLAALLLYRRDAVTAAPFPGPVEPLQPPPVSVRMAR